MNHNITITENRATTDSSVKLLQELESAARSKVEKSISIPSNELKGVIHFSRDPLSCCTNVCVLYDLNGFRHKVDVKLDDFRDSDKDVKMDKIIKAVSDHLAVEILRKSWDVQALRNLMDI